MYLSGNSREYPRLDLTNYIFEKMFFEVDKKVSDKKIKENIGYCDFDKFNTNIKDSLIKDIYDKHFTPLAVGDLGKNLQPKDSRRFFTSEIVKKNNFK